MVTKTKTGTLLLGGIEYNEYPPPQQLRKAMEKRWANDLIQRGLIRIRKMEYYRQWENDLFGDPNDGFGLYHLDTHPMQTDSINDVYAWCLSLPDISNERLLDISEQGKYDRTIMIHTMDKLLTRMQAYLQKNNKGFYLHCGYVNYNRGEEVDKETLNSQKFHFNVFQKAPRFHEDKEYRVSIINYTFEKYDDNHLDIVLGGCSDIISIESLPNSRSRGRS